MEKYGVVQGEEKEPETLIKVTGPVSAALLAQLDEQLAKRRQLKKKPGIAVGPSVEPSGK